MAIWNRTEQRENTGLELDRVRAQGYAVDNEENEVGVRCFAVPVFDYQRQVVAAISVSTIVSRVEVAELEKWFVELMRMANNVSNSLGHRA